MQSNSLSFRLIFTSAILAVVLLVTAAFLLAYLFQSALERNFDARLRAILDGLLANVELGTDGAPGMSGRISDPRFTIPLSGWYWQVSPPPAKALGELASKSALEMRLIPTEADLRARDAGGVASFYIEDSKGQQLRAIEQKLKLFGGEDEFSFLVAGNFDELKAEVTAFRSALYAVLSFWALACWSPSSCRCVWPCGRCSACSRPSPPFVPARPNALRVSFPTRCSPWPMN